jgi:hypothetical protein
MRNPEKWKVLCNQAITEQDPEKFMALLHEIERLLAEKEDRIGRQARENPK